MVSVDSRGAARVAAIFLGYAFCGVALGIVFYLTLPNLLRELEVIARKLPHKADPLEELGQDAVVNFRRVNLPTTIQEAVDNLLAGVTQDLERQAQREMQIL